MDIAQAFAIIEQMVAKTDAKKVEHIVCDQAIETLKTALTVTVPPEEPVQTIHVETPNEEPLSPDAVEAPLE